MAKMKKKSWVKLVKAGVMYSNLRKLRDQTELMDMKTGEVLAEDEWLKGNERKSNDKEK